MLFGRYYWAGLVRWLQTKGLGERKISPGDMDLMLLTDDRRSGASDSRSLCIATAHGPSRIARHYAGEDLDGEA